MLGLLAGCGGPVSSPPAASTDSAKADAVLKIVKDTMAERHLKAVIVRVTVDGKEVLTQAVGDSMTGVPATPQMHFRNGAVAISYVSTLLLKLVDDKKVRLDDKMSKWLPDFPHADEVTLGQLAQMTSGYPDYVLGNDAFDAALYADPFKQWTTDDILAQIRSRPLLYPPGTNWNYAHTNYVLLGLALEKATGQDMPTLLNDKVLRPLGLSQTANFDTPEIPSPVLHAFSSERRAALKIPPGTPFYEESTYWNPSWSITHGAIQTTNIYDLEATAVGIGSGKLLSADSYKAMVSTDLRGKTHAQHGLPNMLRTERRLHLRARHHHLRALAPAEPAARRLRRRRGVPAVAEDRGRGRKHLRATGLRRSGQLLQRGRHLVPAGRHRDGAERRAADAAREIGGDNAGARAGR